MSPGLKVGVVGAGYVGLTTAVCLAAKGFDTVCMDSDPRRVAELHRGRAVIDEPDLEDLLRDGLRRGDLSFSCHHGCLADCDVVFVCVPTPTSDDGSADLRAVESVADTLAATMRRGSVVALKSTVPVGTCRRLGERLHANGIHAVSNPEFLREGHAVYDFRHPDRVVIGATDEEGEAADRVAELYAGDTDTILRMGPESAELAKYASNAFLAVKLSFVNSLAELCGRLGADIGDVTGCMGADERIGPHFLAPGPGWGGSCLPKDTAALVHTGQVHGIPLREVESARQTNSAQTERIAATLRQVLHRRLEQVKITALGLTFKAGTSDIRDSPAIAICAGLQRAGAQVTAYDPRLDSIDSAQLPMGIARDPYVAAKDADAILVLTEWPEFSDLDWDTIGQCAAPGAVVIDTRNILDGNVVRGCELICLGNGTARGY
ncbi:MAG: UDP-glucose/GDP-mannose dehydrogenase family protein [Mycobacterium sp.]|nr:UDP-glucose/GDP-mannose dehydrogenase family protein [Mycobacterium sp.]